MMHLDDIRYVTFFPRCEPVHLKKDVGMIPYSLGKYKKYDYKIVCYQNDDFTNEEISRFHIDFVKKNKHIGNFIKYLLVHGKKIDVLNIYHITSVENIFLILAYKYINPKGKVHLKLDADYRMVDLIDMNPKSIVGKIKLSIFKNKVDLYTIESNKMKSILIKTWNLEMTVIPNGIFRENNIKPVLVEEKKKVFLTVGRLGTEQKATEDLLEAFSIIAKKIDWNLWLVGSIEASFDYYLKKYFVSNPHLKNRVKIWGEINNEEELTRIYRQASVFVLPSKYEGFPIVLMEALECGEYLILSDKIPSSDDVGRNGLYASIIPFHQVNILADKMLESVSRDITNEILQERNEWVMKNYTWKTIINKLDDKIKNLFKNK